MIESILKRDGRKVNYDNQKIAVALKKAFAATNKAITEAKCELLINQVEAELENTGLNEPQVEQVQDLVEKVLIENGYIQTAKSYILYRAERSRLRELNSRLMKTFNDITFTDAKDSDIKRENANVDGDTAMGTMLKYGSEGAKHFYEMNVLNPAHSKAHKSGDIHIHDLDFLTLTTTCCQIDILKLFKDGFNTGHGTLREPNDVQSYSALACIAIQSNQNDQHGGQSIVNFDYGIAPGVAKTYKKLYRQNIENAFELLFDSKLTKVAVNAVDELAKSNKFPLYLNMEEFESQLKELIIKNATSTIDESLLHKALAFASEKSTKSTERATFQAMEALIHNLNTMHSRAGAQTPFSSINYGMDTSPEGRLVIKSVLLAQERGLGNGETPIFPIHIFRVKKGINYEPGDISYDLFKLAIKVSAKRLFPNFAFQDAPFNLSYYKEGDPKTEIAYMGCRTRVLANEYDHSKEISYGRGNLSFTSINLPRLGINAHGDIDRFFSDLDQMIDLCIEQLLERFEIQARKKVRNFPFLMGAKVWIDSETLGPDDEIRDIIKHGTLSVGFIGLAEALIALTGKHHGESETSQNLGLSIIGHMRDRMDAAVKATGLNFSLLATPAEGLSGRFIKLDAKRYGIIPGVTDKEYYTNSFHVPVYYSLNAFKKIKIEAPYHALTNAGHITYVELDGDPLNNLEAFEAVIHTMCESGIGYGSVNHPVDRDPVCGYTGVINEECPKCHRHEEEGAPFDRIRRITGYLVGTLDRFNNAKLAEVRDRVKHNTSKKLQNDEEIFSDKIIDKIDIKSVSKKETYDDSLVIPSPLHTLNVR